MICLVYVCNSVCMVVGGCQGVLCSVVCVLVLGLYVMACILCVHMCALYMCQDVGWESCAGGAEVDST